MALPSTLTPSRLRMPAHITEWRPVQSEAIEHVMTDEERFTGLAAPVGMGKSAIGIAAAVAEGSRAIYLTFTKTLQNQLWEDFAEPSGLALIKGRGNYHCRQFEGMTCEEAAGYCGLAACSAGHSRCSPADCDDWAGECAYKLDFADAFHSDLVCANYAYWVQIQRFRRDSLRPFDIAILDEAHGAPEGLCDLLSVELSERELHRLRSGLPNNPDVAEQWREWARVALTRLEMESVDVGLHSRRDNIRRALEIQRLTAKLGDLVSMSGDWVVERRNKGFQIQPVYAYQHAESRLFCGVKKVVLMSGTLTRKTMALLGLHPSNYAFHAYPYAFPVTQCPVYYVPTVRLRWDSPPEAKALVFMRAARIIKDRADRKGIIHTVSYDRARELITWLRDNEPDAHRLVMTHEPYNLETRVSQFKASRSARVFISPSLTTGYDFPGPECEYVVWLKLPFPNMGSAVMKAREARDHSYPGYLMMQELMQGSYRGMRRASDWCEIFLLDDTWTYARSRFRSYISPWFHVRNVDTVPAAPKTWAERQLGAA